MTSQKKKTYDRGLMAERFAAAYLWFKGYKILHNRYKTSVGEIDLIVKKKNLIVFVEVKARGTKRDALESITPKMRNRIIRTAQYFCARNDVKDSQMRFDVIAFTPPFFIHHLDNVWALDSL